MIENAERVQRHTAEHVNERIRRRIEQSVFYYANRLEDIERRINELDREWDIERTLQANAASLMLAGLTLGTLAGRKWLLLPFVVAGFLLQHAVQGWCPPLPVLRRLGFRTHDEIDRERYALKALRGDFNPMAGEEQDRQVRADNAIRAARA